MGVYEHPVHIDSALPNADFPGSATRQSGEGATLGFEISCTIFIGLRIGLPIAIGPLFCAASHFTEVCKICRSFFIWELHLIDELGSVARIADEEPADQRADFF